MPSKKPAEQLTYKQMSDELDEIILKFDDPDIEIEQSIKLYESAANLIKKIEDYLNTAQNKIEQLKQQNKQ